VQTWLSYTPEQIGRRCARFLGYTASQVVQFGPGIGPLCKSITARLCSNFCCRHQETKLLHQQVHAALWAYLLPQDRPRRVPKSNQLWCLVFAVGITITLSNLLQWSTRPFLRNVLRALPVDVQRCILQGKLDSATMRDFLDFNMQLLHGSAKCEAVLYIALHARCKAWYAGRTKQNRQRGQRQWDGPAARWREHLVDTYRRPSGLEAKPRRYQLWSRFAPFQLSFLAVQGGTQREVIGMEDKVIRTLQPPTQCTPTGQGKSWRQRRCRPWPNQRRTVAIDDETDLNVWQKAAPRNAIKRASQLWGSWEEFCAWARRHWRMSPAQAIDQAFQPSSVALLVLLCSSWQVMLPWRKCWQLPHPTETLCNVWVWATRLPPTQRRRAREKVERFLRTSHLLRFRPFTLRVPCRKPFVQTAFNHFRDTLRWHFTRMWGQYTAKYLTKKCRLFTTRPTGVHEKTADNVSTTKHFTMQCIEHVPQHTQQQYLRFDDVRLAPFQCNVEGFHDQQQAVATLWRKFQECTASLANPLLADDLWATAERLCRMAPGGADHTAGVVDEIRQYTGGAYLASVDRDPYRRAIMEADGYNVRLYRHFADSPETYRQRSDLTTEGVAIFRRELAKRLLPPRVQRAEWGPRSLPSAYLTYKSKCFSNGVWSCSSDHKHVREICSAACDPAGPWLSTVARAIRVVHKAQVRSDLTTFMLWAQGRVPESMLKKVKHLRVHFRTPGVCPCGTLFSDLQIVKADATAFFTSVKRSRCLEEIEKGLDALEQRGFRAVLLHKESKNQTRLLGPKGSVPRSYRVVWFHEIRRTLRFVDNDSFFSTGDVVWERTDGLPMGSPPSPPTTAYDLDLHSRRMYESKKHAQAIGVHIPGIKTSQVVQGLLHVDDSVVFSKIFCCSCLGSLVQRLWPKDVSAKIEASGPTIPFLHCVINAHPNSIFTNHVTFTPTLQNLEFCLGLAADPKTSKFPQYLSSSIQCTKSLQPVLWGKIAVLVWTCLQCSDDFLLALTAAITEPLLMGWPPVSVGRCLASFPRSHRGIPSSIVRIAGRFLRKYKVASDMWVSAHRSIGPHSASLPWFPIAGKVVNLAVERLHRASNVLPAVQHR